MAAPPNPAGVTVVHGSKPAFDPLSRPAGGNPFLTGRAPAAANPAVSSRPSLTRPAGASNPFVAGRAGQAQATGPSPSQPAAARSEAIKTDAFASLRQSSMTAGGLADLWIRGRQETAMRGSLGARAGIVLARRVAAARSTTPSSESVHTCLETAPSAPNKLAATSAAGASPSEAFSDAEIGALADAGCWAAVMTRLSPLFAEQLAERPPDVEAAAEAVPSDSASTKQATLYGLTSDTASSHPSGTPRAGATPARAVLLFRALLKCGSAQSADRLAGWMLGLTSPSHTGAGTRTLALRQAYATAIGLPSSSGAGACGGAGADGAGGGVGSALLPLPVLVAHAALPMRRGRPSEAAYRCTELCRALADISLTGDVPSANDASAVCQAWGSAVCGRAAGLRGAGAPLRDVIAELRAAAEACLSACGGLASQDKTADKTLSEGLSTELSALLKRAELSSVIDPTGSPSSPTVSLPSACMKDSVSPSASLMLRSVAHTILRTATDAAAGAGDSVGAAQLMNRAATCVGWSLSEVCTAAINGLEGDDASDSSPAAAIGESICHQASLASVLALIKGSSGEGDAMSLASVAIGAGQLALGPAGAVRDAESLFLLAVEAALVLPPSSSHSVAPSDSKASGESSSVFQCAQESWCTVAGIAPLTSEHDVTGSATVGWPEVSDSAALFAASDRVRLCSSAVTGVALCRLHAGQPEYALNTIREFVVSSPCITACAATVATAMTLTDLCRGPQASIKDKEALKLAVSAFGAKHAVSMV